jgi:hypothetical protein
MRRQPLISPFETAGGPPGFGWGGPWAGQAENPRGYAGGAVPQGSGLRESAPDLGRSLEPMCVSAHMDDLTLGPAADTEARCSGNPGSSPGSRWPFSADSAEGFCTLGLEGSGNTSSPSLLPGGVTPWMGKKRGPLRNARGSCEMERDLSRGSLPSPWLSWTPAWQQTSRGVDVP